MSKFFESEIIRNELTEINELQETVYGSMLTFGSMEREEQIEHVDMLNNCLLYTSPSPRDRG